MKNAEQIQKFTSAGGAKIYALPVEAFPNHVTNCYLVLDGSVTLIDTGSGFDGSNESLLKAFETLADEFSESVKLHDVTGVILTHAHIDHFGGINFVVEQSNANVHIHELDANVIRHFHDSLVLSTKNLHLFLDRAGISPDRVTNLLEMNKWSKDYFRATSVSTFAEGPLGSTGFVAYHTPGHCPGQVCLQKDDILFTADHILSHTTPNQAPESIARYTGLGHYFDSLELVRERIEATVALGGHEDPIHNLRGRIDEIVDFHQDRLAKLLDLCDAPKNVNQLSQELFGPRKHYHILLAILETGAHIEYLYERGYVRVANMDDVEHEYNPVLLYERT